MKPTPAELLSTAKNLIRAAELLLKAEKKHPPSPRRRRRLKAEDPPLTQEELRAAFAELRRSLQES